MVKPTIIEESPLCLAEVAEHMAVLESRDSEPDFRSQRTKEYFESFTPIKREQAEKLRKKLASLELSRLKELHTIKIVDLLPKTADEVKILLQGYPLSMTKKDMESIAEAVNECAS